MGSIRIAYELPEMMKSKVMGRMISPGYVIYLSSRLFLWFEA